MIPNETSFPYTVRVVSDIMESNGSSSMASVCGASLSLHGRRRTDQDGYRGYRDGLDHVDGQTTKQGVTVLTDILGDEDHFGDMDFKVAGSKDGITADTDGYQDQRVWISRRCGWRWNGRGWRDFIFWAL